MNLSDILALNCENIGGFGAEKRLIIGIVRYCLSIRGGLLLY